MAGLSDVQSALHETWEYIRQFDIVMLSETQTAAPLHRQLPQHTVHTIPASTHGRRGEGLLLAVSRQLPFAVTHTRTDQDSCVIWLSLRSSAAHRQNITIAVCYVPPDSQHSAQLQGRSAQARFTSLTDQLITAAAQGHVLLAGDLNARVGSRQDLWVTEFGGGLPVNIQNTDSTINAHGRKLIQLCSDTSLVLCTGRAAADIPAQPSFKARINTAPSRLDHFLVDPELFPFVQSCRVGPSRPDSDHMPLEMRLLLDDAALPPRPTLSGQAAPRWVWDETKREPYTTALLGASCQAALQQSCAAAAVGDLYQADAHFQCSLNTAAGLAGFRRTHLSAVGPPRPFRYPWFNSQCASLKAQIKQHKRLGTPYSQLRPLQRQYQTQLRHSMQAYNRSRVQSLSQLLKTNPHQFWRGTRLPCSLLPVELQSPAAWDGYLATLAAPPAQPATQLPQPHTAQPPTPAVSLNRPLSLAEIELALQQLHNGRSGALLGYSSELLRYARLSPSDDDPAPANLLLPCLHLLFNIAFSTGSVPQSWKTSLVTPVFKKGDATDTSNYRPIAVGEPLSRLYASILARRLVEYTEENQLRSPTQAGYRPQHSTIHQAFVLQHVIDKHRHLQAPLHLCFVDLKSAYDKVQWQLLWDTLQRLGIHAQMSDAIQSLYTDCLLSMRVGGKCGQAQTPAMGLRQGCPLSATLFGLFIDGLHHHLEAAVPAAGVALRGLRLRELVYADDICLLATDPVQLQALIDAMAAYFGALHMDISVPKTKVMVLFAGEEPATSFTCNGSSIEQVDTFKYLGLHFHQSGDISHLIQPIKNKASGSWAAVQRRHSLLECGTTVNIHLQLLQSILVPALHYGCEVWGMHSPDWGAAKGARLGLQRTLDYYLRKICHLSPSTPRDMLLTELGLLPLQVFWWRQALQFWNNIHAMPAGSFFHTVLLDNLHDAFHGGACNFSSSVAFSLRSVGVSMPHDSDRVPVLDVPAVVDALKAHLRGPAPTVSCCPRQARSSGIVQYTYDQWFRPFSARRRYCHLPVSGKNMQLFLQFRLGCHELPVATGRRSGIARSDRRCTSCAAMVLGDERHLVFECASLATLRVKYAGLFQVDHSMRSFFAQQDHLGVFHYIVECLNIMQT